MKPLRIKKAIMCGVGLFLIICFYWVVMDYLNKRVHLQAQKDLPVTISEQEAIAKARAFCNAIDIICSGKVTVGNARTARMPGIENYNDLRKWHLKFRDGSQFERYSHYYDAYVTFEGSTIVDRDKISPYIILGIGRRSNKIESYETPKRYFELSRKYGHLIASTENPEGRFEYSPFISEIKARYLIDSLSVKAGLPSDMVLEKIEKNTENGVWNAIWLRKKGEYLYEGDGAIMSISGVTGELLLYEQHYQGIPCPTDLKIDKERALELAWKKLYRINPWLIFWKAMDYYNVKTELRIVPIGKFLDGPVPIKFKDSRLAWIVTFRFTGGLKFDEDKYFASVKSAEKQRLFKQYIDAKKKIRRRMFFPENMFEVRIDAITGSTIYADRVDSIFSRLGMFVFD